MRFLRYFLGLFRSHGGSHQVALGFCLGIFCGIVPSLWQYIVLWSVLLIVFRISLPAFCLAASLFKSFSIYFLHSLAYETGYYLLEKPGLVNFWDTLNSKPALSLLGLDSYLVLGSVVTALVIAIPLYAPLFLAHRKISRSKFSTSLKESESLQKLAKLAFGDKPFKPNRFFRGGLALYSFLLLAVVFLLISLFSGMLVEKGIEKWGSKIVGAPVKVEEASWNWRQGKFTLRSFAVLDPTDNQRQMFDAELLELDLAISSLWRGKIVFDSVGVKNANLRLYRNEKGEFNFKSLKFMKDNWHYLPQAREMGVADSGLSKGEWQILGFSNLDWLGGLYKWGIEQRLIDSYKNVQREQVISEYLGDLEGDNQFRVMQTLCRLPTLEEVQSACRLSPQEILLLYGRASYFKEKPVVGCRKLYCENLQIHIASKDNEQALICNAHVNNFALYERSSEIVQYREPITGKVTCQQIPLGKLLPFYSKSSPVLFDEGRLDVDFSFTYTMCKTPENVSVDTGKKDLSGLCELELQAIKAKVNPRFPEITFGGPGLSNRDGSIAEIVDGLNSLRDVKIPYHINDSQWEIDKEAKARITGRVIIRKSAAALKNAAALFGLFKGKKDQ